MLAVSPLTSGRNERESEMESFADFSGANLLDTIDFDDLFVGISDGDVLPDLEMDSEILAEFPACAEEESESTNAQSMKEEENNNNPNNQNDDVPASYTAASGSDLGSPGPIKSEESAVSKIGMDPNPVNPTVKTGRKSTAQNSSSRNPTGKRKVKVDWTPELHRRFVEAVEQLGVDKAVPSRILELMGIDCLTRHNVASHLQKYRSHRKHLLAREAEAASWSQRRQMYGAAVPGGGGAGKRELNPWIAPTMGFPPPVTPVHHFRPLHVWGHPSIDQSQMHTWPKHLPPHAWPPSHPPPPPSDPSFWISHYPHVPTPGTPCFPPHLGPAFLNQRFPASPVPGMPPPAMLKVAVPPGVPTVPQPPSDVHPSKETIDAAIGDVLSKPWLPLPLGLKPPSVDSVMVELQNQGVSRVPPTSCSA